MSSSEEKLKSAKGFLEAGKTEAGRIALLELLKDEPNNATALLMLGGAYFYEKMYADIEEDYAIERIPFSLMQEIAKVPKAKVNTFLNDHVKG